MRILNFVNIGYPSANSCRKADFVVTNLIVSFIWVQFFFISTWYTAASRAVWSEVKGWTYEGLKERYTRETSILTSFHHNLLSNFVYGKKKYHTVLKFRTSSQLHLDRENPAFSINQDILINFSTKLGEVYERNY